MMKRVNRSRFGWNWLETREWCDGLMDDQGNFVPEYQLFKHTPASIFIYLAWHD